MTRLDRAFFERDTAQIARDLLGRLLVHEVEGQRISGCIVEAEAYMGWDDQASHGFGRVTPRNTVMFGPAGVSYVYLIYGFHYMLNVVAKPPGVDFAGAALIRALEPLEGLQFMAQRRNGRSRGEWTNGPGRLAQALGIDKSQNGIDIAGQSSPLYFEAGMPVTDSEVSAGPRIGLGRKVGEPWLSKAWRFWIIGHPYVSK
jgi:DNA-3-methyladenine glycosylase